MRVTRRNSGIVDRLVLPKVPLEWQGRAACESASDESSSSEGSGPSFFCQPGDTGATVSLPTFPASSSITATLFGYGMQVSCLTGGVLLAEQTKAGAGWEEAWRYSAQDKGAPGGRSKAASLQRGREKMTITWCALMESSSALC